VGHQETAFIINCTAPQSGIIPIICFTIIAQGGSTQLQVCRGQQQQTVLRPNTRVLSHNFARRACCSHSHRTSNPSHAAAC